MPLFYKAVQSPIANKAGAKLWHLNLVKAGGTVATQQLAEVIAEKSSLTAGDVQNVVRNLMSVMREYLLNSRSVRLAGPGESVYSFQPAVHRIPYTYRDRRP